MILHLTIFAATEKGKTEMRDRLIEILKKSGASFENALPEEIAEYLLAEGVIVPPVKVGQTVYRIRGNYGGERIHKGFVSQVNFYHQMETRFWDDGHPLSFTDDDIGKTVFLTREEAEQALAERRGE